jgi:hypothetical protein
MAIRTKRIRARIHCHMKNNRALVVRGAVASYKIERRERPSGPWAIVGIATDTETTLLDQEKAKPWEFRVTAVNKAGESMPSNTVPAVL